MEMRTNAKAVVSPVSKDGECDKQRTAQCTKVCHLSAHPVLTVMGSGGPAGVNGQRLGHQEMLLIEATQ
jgi:hypothetical protein